MASKVTRSHLNTFSSRSTFASAAISSSQICWGVSLGFLGVAMSTPFSDDAEVPPTDAAAEPLEAAKHAGHGVVSLTLGTAVAVWRERFDGEMKLDHGPVPLGGAGARA